MVLIRRRLIRTSTLLGAAFPAPEAGVSPAQTAAAAELEAPGDHAKLFPSREAGPESRLTPTSAMRGEAAESARPDPKHEIAVVVLTRSDRPAQLARAIASVRAQQQVDPQLVLVVNGGARPQPDPSDQLIVLPENVGIPAGRNVGAAAADAQLLMFLDDDAELVDPGLLAAVVDRFKADPRLGAMAIRLIDEDGRTQRRHVPRLGVRSAEKSGPVTHFLGGACVVRAATFHELGGFDGRFFYSMEESDLSWRLLDVGWSIWYSADLRVFHPRTAPSRHHGHAVLTARNRLWMAWRSLPAPMLAAYVLIWTGASWARGSPLRQVLAGYRQAWPARPARHPMRWRTVVRMTMLGRPPMV